MNHHRVLGRIAAVALALAVAVGPMTVGAEDDPPAEVDCGPSALYNLSRLLGHPLELEAIRSHLPTTRLGNFSMEELSQSALACGLRLRGVLLDKGEGRAVDRPMLVFLNRGDHGHFLVVRPLGDSGKLVQVIDSINPPAVLDKATLLAAKSWTGLALILDDSRPWAKPNRWLALTTSVVGIGILLLLYSRNIMEAIRPGFGRRISEPA